MRKNAFRPAEHIAALNNAKRAWEITGKPFSKNDIRVILKGCGIPSNMNFVDTFISSTIVKKIKNGKYTWSFKEPIHIGMLEHIYKEYQNKIKKWNKKKEVITPVEVIPVKTESLIESAIKLLKENNYIVLAPVATVYSEI